MTKSPVPTGEVNIVDLQKQYKAFRKKYGPMLRAAKREMSTTMQRGLVDSIAALAFNAGYNAPHDRTQQVKLRGWKAGVDRRL